MLFMLQLLPLLRKSEHGRVVSIFSGGLEKTNITLEDLDLEKPEAFSMMKLQSQLANRLSVCMDQLADEAPTVTFVAEHPGAVDTGSAGAGLPDERWLLRGFLAWFVWAAAWAFGNSLENVGRRALYLMTSAQYGGKGVPVVPGVAPGKTAQGTDSGGLFTVWYTNEPVVKPELWTTLRKDFRPAIWEHMMEKLNAYL
jgi:hypothetical protein